MRISQIFQSIVILSVFSCSETEHKKPFDQTPLLTNFSQNIIIPAYQDHLSNVETLETKVNNFIATLTVESLTEARSAWQTAALSWKRAEIFNFGPVDDLSVETAMDFWPVSTTGIESSVTAYDGTSTYLDGIGSNKKGLAAIEYMLFHAGQETIINEFAEEKRREYIALLMAELSDRIEGLLLTWVTTYADQFVESTGTDSRASAVLVSNQMLILIEDVKNYKLGTPFGMSSGTPHPELVESPFAGYSMEMIRANIEAIEMVFTGGTGAGFDDYLNAYPRKSDGNESLTMVIEKQILKCKVASAAITVPLEEAITTQGYQVEELITDLTVLNAYLKTDMMSRLNLVVTFTDNDGD
jgi:uncharacterized protein